MARGPHGGPLPDPRLRSPHCLESLVLRGGRVVDATGERPADVLITGPTITAVEPDLHGDRELDSEAGCVVAPGLVDLHVHLREPGHEEAETIETGARAAARGGFTAVLAMPNTEPPQDDPAVVAAVLAAGARSTCDVHAAGCITARAGVELAPMGELHTLGVRVFTDDGACVDSAAVMRRALEYASSLPGAVLAQHAEDAALCEGGHMHEGEWSSRLGIPGRPTVAEASVVAPGLPPRRADRHPHPLPARVHRRHGGVDPRTAKARGLPVTAEAAPHHFTLTDTACATFDPVFKVHPPLRSDTDVATVRAGLADGTLDAGVRTRSRILLADDSEDNRFLISSYLKSLPYSLEFAEDGAIALEKLRTGAYDLALIDVHMPEIDGYAVARSVRNAERGGGNHTIPLIALTADAYASAIEKSIAAGFNAHLTKPIGKQTLLEAIANHARKPERHEAKDMDESGVASLAGGYLKSSRKKAAEIVVASASENFDAIRTNAHNMKGTGTAYGFPRLTELGGILEKSALEKDTGAIREAIHQLFEYLDLLAQEQEAMQETVTVKDPHVCVKSSLRLLVPEFIARLHTGSVGLKDAIQNSDFPAVRAFGHNLKGNGANFGFPILSELGDRLEAAAMRSESETISAIMDELRRYLDSVVIEYE